jgi:NTP pyrophosphatase (non-canonical NTP hydrolase)
MMNRTEHLLTILGEECAEVAQRCSKAVRFGLEESQPGQEKTNAERISEEMSDLIGVFEMLLASSSVPLMSGDLIEAKKAKVEKYLAYSKHCGTLA